MHATQRISPFRCSDADREIHTVKWRQSKLWSHYDLYVVRMKVNPLVEDNVCIISILLRKWCRNNKHFAELALRRRKLPELKELRHCHPMYAWLSAKSSFARNFAKFDNFFIYLYISSIFVLHFSICPITVNYCAIQLSFKRQEPFALCFYAYLLFGWHWKCGSRSKRQ